MLRDTMVFLHVLLLLLLQLPTVSAMCPNACSGHGTCDRYVVCRCFGEYVGHDCSQRRCPRGRSWGVVRDHDRAHDQEECSGRGICDATTGSCICQQGFTGHACQLLSCPDECSDRGRCITMREHADDDVVSRELYDTAPLEYTSVWDADMIRGCRCDAGFHGASCELKRCPLGDDPLTTGQTNAVQLISCVTSYEQQTVTLQADAALTTGSFRLTFGKQSTRPISFAALATLDTVGTSMANALLALTGIEAVTVTRSEPSVGRIDWQISFPAGNTRQNALLASWRIAEVQEFICAADSGTFALTFAGQTVRGIPFSSDGSTLKNALATILSFETIEVTLPSDSLSVCSASGVRTTVKFVQLYTRDGVGDLPNLQFSALDPNGLIALFLADKVGFIDTEAKEVVKGVDTCRVVERQSILCAATSGAFALTFENGQRVSNLHVSTTAAQLRTALLSGVSYLVDIDVTFSSGATTACSTDGTTITIAFVVVKTLGAHGDGDLAAITADKTNGGTNGLVHISNRLQLSSAFTEVTRGATCTPLDLVYSPEPAQQVRVSLAQASSFTVGFRGATTAPIAAMASATQVQRELLRLPTLQGLTVGFTGAQACETPVNTMSLTFTQNFGTLPTVVVDGSALVASGSSMTSLGGNGQSLNGLLTVGGTKESDICSNRGQCDDTLLGRCLCYTGYTSSDGTGAIGTLSMNRGDCGATSRIPVGCPGELSCSGHGTCSGSPTYRCTCAKGWRSGDCSERVCPSALAWFDYPAQANVAHLQRLECSGVGQCDRTTGICKCPRPYTGSACELMLCGGSASECSGNGQCLTLLELAPLVTVLGERAGFSYGSDPNDPLTWDRAKTRACLCDEPYFGYDCSLRACPRGDDPSTYDDVTERQLVQCTATAGSFTLSFRDQATSDLSFDASAETVRAALAAIPALGQVEVTFLGGAGTMACSSSSSTVIVVDLLDQLGEVAPLRAHSERLRDAVNQDGLDGSGRIVVASGGAALLGHASIKGTRENAFCSNHGSCDFETGTCICDAQYGSSNGKGGAGTIGDCGHRYLRQGVELDIPF